SGGSVFGWDWKRHSEDFGNLHISPAIGVLIIAIAVVMILVFLILHLIATGALIDAVNRLARGGVYRLRDSFAIGIDFFWRMFGIYLVGVFAFVILVAAIVVPAVICFLVSTVVGGLSLIVLVPIGLVGMFVITNVFSLTQRALVARNVRLADAIEEGYWLFRNNLGANLVIFIIFMALSIGLWLVAMMIIGLAAGPFIALALTSTTGLIVAIVLGLPIVLIVMWVISGFLGAFFSSLFTLFYFELVEPSAAPAPVSPASNPQS
ncbi:MAG TPA: DUF948 domain-containing protein, partial [Candidatus Acidoferrum sp.]|nr:DUF948 domain-containing protein [Candidatus Acidoferrum sp.]